MNESFVLDSNVLLIAIEKKSRFRPIWSVFLRAHFQFALSDEILFEYEEILHEHAAPGSAEIIMEILESSPNVILKSTYYKWNAITADPDDNKFFDAAVAANADYLVTNDSHFNEVKNLSFPKVRIIYADAFLEILSTTT
jgi:putative PIN family toxin of toxin-antitoxin system